MTNCRERWKGKVNKFGASKLFNFRGDNGNIVGIDSSLNLKANVLPPLGKEHFEESLKQALEQGKEAYGDQRKSRKR